MNETSRLSLRALGGFALLCVVFIATWFQMPGHVFYSPDEGAKFLQMQGMGGDSFPSCRLIYPGIGKDPTLFYYPARVEAETLDTLIYPYLNAEGQVQTNWLPWFPLLTKPFVALLGARGLTVIPLLMGVLSIWLTGMLMAVMEPRARFASMIGLALFTPLLFYGLTFWEHTLALTLQLAALLAILPRPSAGWRARGLQFGLAAIFLMGAILLRREAVFFAVALAGGMVLQNGKAGLRFIVRRRILLLVGILAGGGLLLLLGPWLLPERTAVDLQISIARLIHWDSLALLDDHFFDVFFLLNKESILPLSLRWLGQTGLLICLINCLWPRRTEIFAAGVLLVLPAAAFMAFTPIRYHALNSLVLSAPLVLFALLPDPVRESRSSGERLIRWVALLYAGFFYLGSWPTHRGDGGLEWGSRYALVLFPLLTAIGVANVWRHLLVPAVRRGVRTMIAGLLLLALLLGAGSLIRGIRELHTTQRDLGRIQDVLMSREAPVVTDCWWMAAGLTDLFIEHEVFTVASSDEIHDWLASAGQLETSFVYAGYDPISEKALLREEGRLEPIAHEVICGMGLTTYRIAERLP